MTLIPDTALERRARQVCQLCLLLVPPTLLHGRAIAEGAIAIIALTYLIRCARHGDWGWVRRPIFALPLALWAWLVICSALGAAPAHAVPQALAMLRFWVFVAALSQWLLADGQERARRSVWWLIAASAAWIAIECWQQYLLGTNLLGYPRWGDGSLTGPFFGPRAGPAYVVLLYPALLPPVMALLARPGIGARLAGAALATLGILTLVLIGQRMPALLGLLGLLVSALLLRRLRPAAIAVLVVAALALAALPLVSPPTYQKLVVHFVEQMSHFWQSPYGQLYTRAAAITLDRPLLGHGFDGFRMLCDRPEYANPQALFGLPPVEHVRGEDWGCAIHPHQFWLQAGTDAGIPGLVLFGATALCWWWAMARGLWSGGDALRVGLFVAVFDWLWPIASTSGFYNMPVAGWGFLMAGFGLALSGAGRDRTVLF